MDPRERLRVLYEHFDNDDFEGGRQHLHPDVEWHGSGVFPGLELVNHGHEGVERWWKALREPFERFAIEVEEVWESGDLVIAQVRFHAIGRESGAAVNLPFFHVFRFEDDLVVYYASYGSPEDMKAAGFEPPSGAS